MGDDLRNEYDERAAFERGEAMADDILEKLVTPEYHPAVAHVLQFFDYRHLRHLRDPARTVSQSYHNLAHLMAQSLDGNDETAAGLRKLLEAKDCHVRSSILTDRQRRAVEDELGAAETIEDGRL